VISEAWFPPSELKERGCLEEERRPYSELESLPVLLDIKIDEVTLELF